MKWLPHRECLHRLAIFTMEMKTTQSRQKSEVMSSTVRFPLSFSTTTTKIRNIILGAGQGEEKKSGRKLY